MPALAQPADFHPALTDERLSVLVEVIAKARREAIEVHAPASGETNWSLGCRTYERICAAFGEAKASGQYPWLDLYVHNLYFLILIDKVPVKFYRGSPEDPPSRALRQFQPEVSARQQAFSFAKPTVGDESYLRLSYETDLDQLVFRATLLRVNPAGEVCDLWDVPVGEGVAALSPVVPILREPVDLEPPAVAPKGTEESAEEAANDADDRE